MRPALTRGSLLLGVAGLSLGCGAKSGLELAPRDAGVIDGEPPAIDAASGLDATACLTDADCDDGLACSDDRCVRGACAHDYVSDRCNDGVFCDGLERCEPGVGCVSPGRSCDDGLACTVDVCSEAEQRCLATPDDDRCPLSARCDLARGCIPRALVHDERSLYELDLPSGELHDLGRSPIALTDIALAPDGTFYGASSSVAALVRVDARAGRYEPVVHVEGSFNALDVGPDGSLYGASNERVFVFDLARGRALEIARLPSGFESSGDLAFVEGALYLTARVIGPSTVPDVLFEIDLHGGLARSVGAIGYTCVWGLAPLGPRLYGVSCEGVVLEIDVATGAGAAIAPRLPHAFWGAASR